MNEEALESVTGGTVSFKKPVYDPAGKTYLCPACGHTIIDNAINNFPEKLQCPGCGRWFRIEELTRIDD